MKSIIYIGMDVHKNSYSLCSTYGKTGEILGETKISPDIRLVEKFVENVKKKINDHDVEVKEYIRMMNDFKDESKKVKQHINAFVLRMRHRYEGRSRWIPAHIKWLKELEPLMAMKI